MRKQDITDTNIKSFKLVNDVLTKIRNIGVDFEEPVDNSKFMAANFIKYLMQDKGGYDDYLYLSLEASVDGFKSMVDGFIFNGDKETSKEFKQRFKEFKDSCSDINMVAESIIEGANERYNQLMDFEDLMLKSLSDPLWEDYLSVERIKLKRKEKELLETKENINSKRKP